MVIEYKQVIHCSSQEQVTAEIRKSGLNWLEADYMPQIDDPAQHEIDNRFYANAVNTSNEFYLIIAKCVEHEECLFYAEYPEHDWDKIKQTLIVTDCADSINNCKFIESKVFSSIEILGFDVYDVHSNHIGTIDSSEDLEEMVRMYGNIVIYHNGNEYQYNSETNCELPI